MRWGRRPDGGLVTAYLDAPATSPVSIASGTRRHVTRRPLLIRSRSGVIPPRACQKAAQALELYFYAAPLENVMDDRSSVTSNSERISRPSGRS